MASDDVDDVFKDFEHKVEGKEEVGHTVPKETHKSHKTHEKKLSEEDILKNRFEKAEQVLKHKYRKEKEALLEKKKIEIDGNRKITHRNMFDIERVASVAIILVLVIYIGIDLSFYHGDNSSEQEDQTITSADVKLEEGTDDIEEEVAEQELIEEEPETVVEEKKTLSGKITLKIDDIDVEVSNKDNDLGYINKVFFTIENGKDKTIRPVLHVFAYDSELDSSYETRSRGKYTGTAIKSGDKLNGIIDLSPKSFRNLDIEKSIRLTLNDTGTGFITSVNMDITIS